MRNYIEQLGLRRVINASGKMTALGVSKVSDEVATIQKLAGQSFFVMDELMEKSGAHVAKLLKTGDAQIVPSASTGIVLSVAAVIGKGDRYHLYHPFDEKRFPKREIIIPKGHNIDYGAPIDIAIGLGGGILREVGYANGCSLDHIRQQINDNTAAILYVKSHHTVQKSMPTVAEVVAVAKEYDLPMIVDAAAEEDVFFYTEAGADIVIYSGAKAFEGPTSGLVIGKKEYIEWVRLQNKGIGRSMKIGKENVFGLIVALENYLNIGPEPGASMQERLTPFIQQLNQIPGLDASIVQDSAGRDIYRARIKFADNVDAKAVVQAQQSGNPAIFTRDYQANIGIIEYDVRAVDASEMDVIVDRLKEIISSLT